ncbi:tetratricopeptide repeat protein [Prochlorococcus marinus]|uniref:tetratricopeptide repeat protein n=1 Tax=Prochlorococcus marinus TaxID=1219 RepID=UPI0022B3B127|nr:tetratricopeptide repeat protein [Prochlorococcus marinus]
MKKNFIAIAAFLSLVQLKGPLPIITGTALNSAGLMISIPEKVKSESIDKNKSKQNKHWKAGTDLHIGNSYLDNDLFPKAIESFSRAINRKPPKKILVVAYFNRALAKSNLKDYSGAISDFSKVIEINPKDEEAYFRRGIIQHQLANYQSAINDFSMQIKRNKNSNSEYSYLSYYGRANSKRMIGDYSGALSDDEQFQKLATEFMGFNYKQGLKNIDNKDYKDAIISFNKVIDIRANHWNAYRERGRAKYQSGDYQGALEDTSKAIEGNALEQKAYRSNVVDSDLHNIRGLSNQKLGDFSGAKSDFTIAINGWFAGPPRPEEMYFNRGIVEAKLGNHEEAINDFNKALEINSNLVSEFTIGESNHIYSSYVNRSFSNLSIKNYDAAINDLSQAIDIDPKDPTAYNNRAKLYYLNGNFDRSCKDSTKAASLGSKESIKILKGPIGKKICYMPKKVVNDKSITLKWNNPNKNKKESRFLKAENYVKEKRYSEAIIEYSRIINKNPSDSEAYYRRGWNNEQLENYPEAIKDFNRAIEIDPKFISAYFARAWNKGELKDYSGALNDYSKAIEINPNYLEAYTNRGIIKAELGDKKGACRDYKKAIELGSKSEKRWLASDKAAWCRNMR